MSCLYCMMFTYLSSRVVVRRPVILYSFFGVTWHLVMIWLAPISRYQIQWMQTPYSSSVCCLKSFHAYGFRVSKVLYDGASSNLTLLRMLCGYPRAVLPVNDAAEVLRARYFVDMSFTNPEDSSGSPVFAMICPSHQVVIMCCFW